MKVHTSAGPALPSVQAGSAIRAAAPVVLPRLSPGCSTAGVVQSRGQGQSVAQLPQLSVASHVPSPQTTGVVSRVRV